jgi:hypothetical protein
VGHEGGYSGQIERGGGGMRDDDKTDLPGWLGLRSLPDFTKARWLGAALSVVVIVLFVMAVSVVMAVLGHALFDFGIDAPRIGFGTGAVAVALIGAPFVIWRSVVAQKTVNVTEQGHITDRINTAVQGLGAEKVVDRIGRPITIWTGKPRTLTHPVKDPEKFALPPRAIEMRRYQDISAVGHPDNDEYYEGLHTEVISWPEEKTIIEWQGTVTALGTTERLGKVGEWKVFTETQPNLEVRIGAIYALERIAQDSDRDHVQIMEILCAYIRQNAPAPAEDESDQAKIEVNADKNASDFLDWNTRLKVSIDTHGRAKNSVTLREDVQVALEVIGRRDSRQRRLEAGRGEQGNFQFDIPCPGYDRARDSHDLKALKIYYEKLSAWKQQLSGYEGYRLDLRNTDLRGADLSRLNFNGARLSGARLEGAVLLETQLHNADLQGARLQGANLMVARLQGALLTGAKLQEATLIDAYMHGAFLVEANLGSANLGKAQLQGANLASAQFDSGTYLSGSDLRGTAVKSIDFSTIPHIAEQIPTISEDVREMFGDASVTLPGGQGDWPDNWATFDLGNDFFKKWRVWQADPENYTPPDPPDPDETA